MKKLFVLRIALFFCLFFVGCSGLSPEGLRYIIKNRRISEMKRKYFLVVLVLVLAIFLSGCSGGGITTPATDEAKVKSAINEYFLAINDQNWSKAKSYCVYGLDRYYATCGLEDGINVLYQYASIVTITCFVTISDVNVSGGYADAFISGTILITADGYSESESATAYYWLQKIGNSWKIYHP